MAFIENVITKLITSDFQFDFNFKYIWYSDSLIKPQQILASIALFMSAISWFICEKLSERQINLNPIIHRKEWEKYNQTNGRWSHNNNQQLSNRFSDQIRWCFQNIAFHYYSKLHKPCFVVEKDQTKYLINQIDRVFISFIIVVVLISHSIRSFCRNRCEFNEFRRG